MGGVYVLYISSNGGTAEVCDSGRSQDLNTVQLLHTAKFS